MPGKELRISPHNSEAEESVLGSLLIDKNAIVKVADWISPPDFYHHNNAVIYAFDLFFRLARWSIFFFR